MPRNFVRRASHVDPPRAGPPASWFLPDEAAPHARTWMAFGASRKLWGSRSRARVRRTLTRIAHSIARYEPVTMLVQPRDRVAARNQLGSDIACLEVPMDDIWLRDTGPLFVHDAQGALGAIDGHFNGWGGKQTHARDARLAACIAQHAGATSIDAPLVLEGGAIEVDGAGTAILTESCLVNDNRNPGRARAELDALLKPLLGLEKILWLPGIRAHDITDGHTDFYVRFARPGTVAVGAEPDPACFDHAVTERHLELLRAATDARGQPLECVVIPAPTRLRVTRPEPDFAAGYVNFYVCNGAALLPEFGDAHADGLARERLADLFPGRDIRPIDIDSIAIGGGGLHCVTLAEPEPPPAAG